MARPVVEIDAINRERGEAFGSDGATYPVETWIDDDGDETCDAVEAIFAVVRIPANVQPWTLVDLRCFGGDRH